MKINNNKKLSQKNKILMLAVLSLLLVVGASAYYLNDRKDTATPPSDVTQAEGEKINFNPPTENEKKQTEEFKKNLETQPEQGPQSTGKTVKPVITSYGVYGGDVEVASRVPGAFEGSGTCTLKLSMGGKVVSKSRKAIQNVSEMSCGFITIPTSQLSSGTWSATVSYKSQELSGTSAAVNIRVP